MIGWLLAALILLVLVAYLASTAKETDLRKIGLLIDEGRLEEASKILKIKLNRNNNNPLYHWLMTQIYEHEVNFEYAIVELKIITKNRLYTPLVQRETVLVKLVDLYERVGKAQDILPLIVEEHKIRWNQTTLYLLGHICLLVGDLDKAKGFITKVLQIQPNYAPALTDQALIKMKLSDTEGAILDLESAVNYDRKYTRAHFQLGMAYVQKGEFDKAIRGFDVARVDRDFRMNSLFQMALCYRKKDMNKNAIEYLERIVTEWDTTLYYSKTMPPSFIVEARYQLAERYFDDKDYQSALDQWREIQTVVPDYRDVSAKITSNSRLGKDRIQDFIIAPAGEFEKISLFILEAMGFRVSKMKQETKEKVVFHADEDVKGRSKKTLIWFVRFGAPVTESIMKELDAQMKLLNLHSAYIFSPSGFATSATKFIFDKPIKLMGRGQFVKMLRAYEGRHSSSKGTESKG